jgi:penicillin-binding protein 1C
VLALDARYSGWAERERLDIARDPHGSGEGPGFLAPRDGDEFLLEAGVPASSQTIPVRVRGEGRLRVDGAPTSLDALGRTRLALAAGVHRLELWEPSGRGPLGTVEIRVRGGDRRP